MSTASALNERQRAYLLAVYSVDQGTGSTFEALRARGLVVLRSERGLLGEDIPFVRLTAAGRKLARRLLGQQAPRRLPAGTLPQSLVQLAIEWRVHKSS